MQKHKGSIKRRAALFYEEMKEIVLDFQGYTWDQYFYVIAHKSGILLTYRGDLDNEGAVRLKEILSVDGADNVGEFYESARMKDIRNTLKPGEMLFFSLAEIDGEEREISLNCLQQRLNKEEINYNGNIVCKGACTLL